MQNVVETDIAIIGGGIAGLWLLNRLRGLGLSVILFESATLGGGQTHKAQGIIHGGVKYALQGALTNASQNIADMPAVWSQCLQGKGEIDLTAVPVLSQHQYLWSTGKLTSKLSGFLANIALQSRVQALPAAEYPKIFQHPAFKGAVYSLDEMAIDVHVLIRELVKPNQDVIFKIDPTQETQLQLDAAGRLISFSVQTAASDPVQIKAQKYIFTAGCGNELFLQKLNHKTCKAQRRPLHMVILKTDYQDPVFAHCFGIGATPRMTITTHQASDGKMVWYLGGQIAEEGVSLDSATQITVAKKELAALFPWLDFSKASFASFFVDRAEAAQAGGKRPDGASLYEIENMIVAWPTKLALAPQLATTVIRCLEQADIQIAHFDLRALRAFPLPPIAKPMWDELL